ncbi:sensor histidine kinase [Flavisolibacter tropicus]|uniref:histidine kinase n=1 Tax=Flavisolibacter tropicus TaxID=1492898 RepID=A0A172TSB4_9BACT|nr:HAMP domain-containing sensor histidine kinase [Flavisolibacter tropicus]ANE49975.1 histidine kinase [Flavisolibacter tropicus]
MFRQLLTWRALLALVAILIVSGTISYSSYLAKKIEKDEREKVEQWVEAGNFINNPSNQDIRLASLILIQTDIPIIETNEKDSITNWVNLDSAEVKKGWPNHEPTKNLNTNNYLKGRLVTFQSSRPPIEWTDPLDSTHRNRYYYGNSKLLNEVQYYPIVQLFIVALFIIITILAIRSSYLSTQNQVWAGMAKETAHQLGTPVSSLEGWLEILRETPGNEKYVPELEKDISRLRLVSDRFGKIGSSPQLEKLNVVKQVEEVVEYVRKRAPGKVLFKLNNYLSNDIIIPLSGPLFDWVIENLLKNALDAMEGKGSITIDLQENKKEVIVDVSDTGKGISSQNLSKVFKPGFTTKKRGWGLGLSLSKRIIEQYHKGSIEVKNSELGKGTTFRIILKK